ncbi:hypothetical protein AYO44_09100 [Planctomycetaceae bacterium SCGC AG-212-F19]|nr:hypothetical protein AYO44_09100 [Planctomycetaceae bacterium SCGC AG-212-F19]
MNNDRRVCRRSFLRGVGVTLTLPLLESMGSLRAHSAANEPPRRMICINSTLGLHTPNLFPARAGRDYELTPYLEPIKDFRNDFTVFSGLSHPQVDGGHPTELCYLTSAPHPGADNFKNTISLDQFAVERLVPDTRFGSLVLASSHNGLSITRSGVPIPPEQRPSRLFKSMFVNGTPAEIEAQVQRLKQGQSVMDAVLGEAKDVQQNVGKQDKQKLDEYFNSIREVEKRMLKAQEWAIRPKPKVDAKPPVDVPSSVEVVARVRLMIDMMHLALQTDSTRFITFALNGFNAVPVISGVTQDWHNLSHHGQDPAKLAELRIIEVQQMQLLGELLANLKGAREDGGTLLDRTILLFGSNLGNASSHDNKNLPIIVAGGGFRHGQHLAFDPKKNPPLCNLFVQFLRRLGAEVNAFGSSNGTIPGFELA